MSEPAYAPSELVSAATLGSTASINQKRKTWLIVVAVATIALLLLIGGCLAITGSPITAADEALSETSASLEPESSSPSPSAGQLDWWVKDRMEWFGRYVVRLAVNGGSELWIFARRAAHSRDLSAVLASDVMVSLRPRPAVPRRLLNRN